MAAKRIADKPDCENPATCPGQDIIMLDIWAKLGGQPRCLPDCQRKRLEGITWLDGHVWPHEYSFVYFIQAGMYGEIKIGHAVNVRQRLKNMQIGNHRKLRLLAATNGGATQEAIYHERFAEHRTRGEWFMPRPPILREVRRLQRLLAEDSR